MRPEDLIEAVQNSLSPDLLKSGYGGEHPLAGHCYVACEALSVLTDEPVKPHTVRHEGVVHWFLRRADGEVVDPTAEQTPGAHPGAGGVRR